MAQHNLKNSPVHAGLSKAHVVAASAAVSSDDLTTPANYQSVTDIDTRLLAIGGIYTQPYLDSITMNDKIYALKLNDDGTNYAQL
jgi:hypothetical protein